MERFDDFWQPNKPKILRTGRWAGLDDREMLGEAWLAWYNSRRDHNPAQGEFRKWVTGKVGNSCRIWRAGLRFGIELDATPTATELADRSSGGGDPLSRLLEVEDQQERSAVIREWVAKHTAAGGTVAEVILGAAAGLSAREIAAGIGVSVRRVNQILNVLGDLLSRQEAR